MTQYLAGCPSRSEQTGRFTPSLTSSDAFALTLQREHERTVRSLGDALNAHQRLSASTQEFSDATGALTGMLTAFRLPRAA